MKKLCVFFILFVFLGSAAWGEEYTWTGVEDNQWTNPENWIDEDGDVPDSYPGENPDAIAIFENSANVSLDDFLPELLDDLIVDTGVALTLIAGNASGFDANALTIDGTLNLEGGNYSITNVITVGSDGVLNLGAQGITAGTINNDGIIDLGSHSITAVTINNNGTLRLVGDSNQFGNRTSMGGTVEFTGIGDMLAGISIFDDLLITGGDRVAPAAITAINITVTNSGSLDMDNETLNVSGDITGFISDIGTLNLTGAGSQVINFGENTTIDTLNKTVAGLAVINDVLTVTGNVHVTNGTLTLGDDFETTSLEIFGGTVNLEGADNDITSVSIGSGTFNPGGSLSVLSLEVLGAAVITNGTSLAVTDLNISNASAGLTGEVQFGGGRVTLPDVSNIVITGVNGTTGALISGDKTITISTNGTVTLGTITGTGERSLSLAGSGNFNSGGNSFTDVTVESGADITLEGNALTCGILDNNGTLTLETQIISVTGAITNDGTINAGTQVITAETITNNASGTLILAGNANQLLLPGVHASMGGTVEYIGNGLTLAGITTFNNLLITSGTRDVAAAITVHDTAEIYSEINADSINIAGAATIGADITTSGVQTYNGTLTLTANVVTFEGSEVNFVNTVTGQDITVISAGNFTVGAGGLEASGTIDLTSSTGGISQAGIITADTLIAGADDGINLELNNNAAQVKLVNLTTGSIVYNSNRSGDVTITAFNDAAGEPVEITVSGNLVVDTVDTTNGISSLDSLTLTANSISHVAGEIIAADSINLYLEDETGMEFLEWTSTTESIFINTRTEKNIVYGSSNPIPGAVWINSAVPGSWDRLVLNSSGNANIFIVNVGVTSRILTAINNAAGDGFIQIRGNYDSSAALVLEPGAFGVQLDAGANVVLQNTLFNLSAPNRNLTLLGVNQTNASITAAGISLGGTINGTSPGNNSLTLDASYAASDNISVTGDVGNLVRLGDITITNSGIFSLTSSADIQLSGSFRQQNSGGTGSSNLESSITTTGGTGETISFDNRVILAAPTVTFTGSTGSLVRFGNTVTGHEIPRVLAVDTANARFENDVGVGIGGNIASVVVDGDSTISGNITTTAPAGQTYNGAVILAANVTFTGSPASAVRFGGTVNSAAVELPAPPIPRELTIANNASVEFNQAAGGENPLASVTVTGTAAISANITTTEEQDYAAVNLFGVTRTLTSTGGYVSASGVVSGDAGVIVRASQGITMSAANTLSGDVTLENNQTGQAVDGDIQFNNASDNINLIAHNDTIEGIIDIEHDGLLSIAGVSSREGEITLKGTEGIVIGSSINTSNGQVIADVNLESADGDITGNGVITAGKLTITAGGSIVLSSELNNVVTLEIPQAGGDVEFVNNGVLTVNAISTAENVEITAISGDIIISGNIGSSTTSVGIVKIVSGNAQNIRIDSTGSINSYSLILIAGEDDDSTGMVTINGNITVESPDGQIGDCYGNAALHIRAGTFEGSGDITLENDGWVCADLLELFDFGGDISPQHIHFHSRNHIVYSNRASSYFGTLIPDGYLYINAENENLGDDLQIISRGDRSIFVVDIPVNSLNQANTRNVTL
ncbi:MAG: hypothetical protein LBC80_00885, partial [Treponema sp.]|nr:hypothetical protein [Treponema sp.]